MAHHLIFICGCGGIGRRTRLRIWRRKAWGFKSLHPHHFNYMRKQFSGRTSPCQGGGRGFESRLPLQCCRGGGTGRRTGLKILRQVTTVPVRFRFSAPFYNKIMRPQLNWIEYLTTNQKVVGSTPVGRTIKREVAQLGRALGLGPRGRRFESCLPDHSNKYYAGVVQW